MITINKVKATSTITVYKLDGVEIARVQQRTNHGPYQMPFSAIIGRRWVDFKCYKDAKPTLRNALTLLLSLRHKPKASKN